MPQPKHRAIFEILHRQIAEGKYSDGRRLPSEMELAGRYSVSRPTAARALRDLQQMGILDRRAGSGTFLKRPKVEKITQRYGLLVPGLGNTEILDPICNEITRFSHGNQAVVLWGDGQGSGTAAEDVLRVCRFYIEEKVTGVFFAPLETIENREAINLQIVNQLRDAGIAIVLLDRDATEYPVRGNCDLVGIDNFGAGLTLGLHLIAVGHKRILFFSRPQPPGTTDLRIAGCREAMGRSGIVPEKSWIQTGHPTDADQVRRLMKKNKPDAIVCSNDRTAAELIQSLTQLGIKVPGDVGVAGFDDVRYATLLSAPLTTMRQPCREIAETAVLSMIERIALPTLPPRQVLLSATLMVRQSCGTRA